MKLVSEMHRLWSSAYGYLYAVYWTQKILGF